MNATLALSRWKNDVRSETRGVIPVIPGGNALLVMFLGSSFTSITFTIYT
jgi:hypothetical protein